MTNSLKVCNRSFTSEMADLVCNELGFAEGANRHTTRYEYNLNNRKKLELKDDLLIARLRCPKKAASLAHCTRTLITKVNICNDGGKVTDLS